MLEDGSAAKAGVMHRFVHLSAPSRRRTRAAHEDDEFRKRWGAAQCDRCGRTLVLGEPLRRRAGQTVCQECVDAAPERPAWILAPARLGYDPVRLIESDLESAPDAYRAA